MADVEVRRAGIEAHLEPQWLAARQELDELRLDYDLGHTPSQQPLFLCLVHFLLVVT